MRPGRRLMVGEEEEEEEEEVVVVSHLGMSVFERFFETIHLFFLGT